MTGDNPLNVAASVRQRLLNIIRRTGDDANLVWTRYATERLLYRLSISEYAGEFILKGAMLFMAWTGRSYRPTIDMDLLGYGEDSGDWLAEVFQNICTIAVEPDGLEFLADSVKTTPIRKEHEYHGQRITMTAFLGKARIPIQVDIGFGDVVTPRAKKISYPTILDFPAPIIWAYPRETVVAEKLQTMVTLGIVNSGMKDFYDLYVLARDFVFNGVTLTRAIKATFTRRKTEILGETPVSLTEEFSRDKLKIIQWNAFVRKSGLEQEVPELPEIISGLRTFLLPPLKASFGQDSVPVKWNAGGPWKFANSASIMPRSR